MDQDLKDMIYEMYDYGDKEVTVVSSGDWIEEGKYSYKESVVDYKEKFYMIRESRSGSYFTDYYYEDPQVFEVTKRVEMVETTFWDVVKD